MKYIYNKGKFEEKLYRHLMILRKLSDKFKLQMSILLRRCIITQRNFKDNDCSLETMQCGKRRLIIM
jgi:hypothetical protein